MIQTKDGNVAGEIHTELQLAMPDFEFGIGCKYKDIFLIGHQTMLSQTEMINLMKILQVHVENLGDRMQEFQLSWIDFTV